MPKLIEIIGSPGSGKSFLSHELEKIKKNDEQIFFHSSNYNKNEKNVHLNILSSIFIRIKVILKIFIFYSIFCKRIFLKKIYKGNFFFRVILLFYEHLIYIEILKKILSNNKYLILEPGPIMYFVQDYFYINKDISNYEIKIFNKFFLNADYIIKLECHSQEVITRLKARKRGFPSRMLELNEEQIETTVNKSKKIINNYISKSNNLDLMIIDIDTSNNTEEIKKKILEFLN